MLHGFGTKYRIEITLLDGQKRIFNNCLNYSKYDSDSFTLETEKGVKIQFYGAYSVEIISMADYKKTQNVHD